MDPRLWSFYCWLVICKLTIVAAIPLKVNKAAVSKPTLACLMIVRDEAENLLSNLPRWTANIFFDAFIIGIDDRTKDNSTEIIKNHLVSKGIPHYIFFQTFHDFGSSRTSVLEAANRHFSNITHIFFVDPDWRPNMNTIHKSDLDLRIEAYQFKINDRSGFSVRYSNWLALHQPNLTFAYYIHEDFRLPNGLPPIFAKHLDWEVDEIEPTTSWHNIVGHGTEKNASRTYKRFLFDIDLLQKEQNDPKYEDSPHTLFYLGLLHIALLEGTEGYKPPFLNPDFKLSNTMQVHLDSILIYLKRLVSLNMDSILTEYVYFSIRWLAYTHFFIMQQPTEAAIWYHRCIEFDTERADCKVELSKLYTFNGDHVAAWKWAKSALLTKEPRKAWTHSYIYSCSRPIQVSRAALNIMAVDDYGGFSRHRYTLGSKAVVEASNQCSTVMFEPDTILLELRYAYDIILSNNSNKEAATIHDDCINKNESLHQFDIDLHKWEGWEHLFCDNVQKQFTTK